MSLYYDKSKLYRLMAAALVAGLDSEEDMRDGAKLENGQPLTSLRPSVERRIERVLQDGWGAPRARMADIDTWARRALVGLE